LSRAAVVALALLLLAGPAAGHHVGTWTPRDNEVSANFKQLKFAMQAQKFDVARQLYAEGALRRELRARAANLPSGLDESITAALAAGDGRQAEGGLMVFFAALVRDLAAEAERQVSAPALTPAARTATGRKFLEAIWRYYSLVDFAVTQRDPKAAAAVRLAYDEAEGYTKDGAAPAMDPARLREPLRQIARAMAGVIEASSSSARRNS
jgi:hypothetical protein